MHSRDHEQRSCNGIKPVSAVGDYLQRRRYVGGLGLATPQGQERIEMAFDYINAGIDMLMAAGATTEAIQQLQETMGATRSPGLMRMDPILQPSPARKKRRGSKYQREFGRQLKALKRKHPRTPVTKLMKRAHTSTKNAMRRRR